MQENSFNKYLLLILKFSFVVIVIIFLSRLFYLQILSNKSESFPLTSSEKSLDRKDIFFTNKDNARILAATTSSEADLILDPSAIIDEQELFEHIKLELDINEKDFYNKIKNKKSKYIPFIKKINEEQSIKITKRIKNFGLKGIFIEKKKKRKYPFNSLAAHVIGFVSKNDKSKIYEGQYGIENSFDQDLRGGKNGSIDLTIEPVVQEELESVIKKINDEWSSEKTAGIIMDPNTGEILAMGVYPTFDLNNFNKVSDISIYRNILIEDIYELGSVFKPLTVAIGLESKSIESDWTYDDKGYLKIGVETIYNFDKKGRGKDVGLQRILSDSLNTGVASIFFEIGKDSYSNYMSAFKFDSATGIELPREIAGRLAYKEQQQERDIEFVTASYGQGIAVTAISAIRAFSAIANGGKIVRPSIIKRDFLIDLGKDENIKIFNENTVDIVSNFMKNSFDYALLGGTLRNSNYSISTKTGTANLYNPNGTISQDKYIHSFYGFFPTSRPKFSILIITIKPDVDDETYASSTLSNGFKDLSDFIIDYYDILPDR